MRNTILYLSKGTDLPKFIKEIYALIKGEESQLYLVYVLEEEGTEKLLERIGNIGFMGEKPRETLKETLYQEYLKRGQEEMDNIVAQLKEKGLDAIGLFRVGKVAQQVLQVAAEIGANLIIIGQTKRHRFPRTFLSPELRIILTHASCQVKII